MTTTVCRQCSADTTLTHLGRLEGEDSGIHIVIEGIPALDCANGHKRFPSPEFPLEFIQRVLGTDSLITAEPAVEKGLFRKRAHCPGCGKQLDEAAAEQSSHTANVPVSGQRCRHGRAGLAAVPLPRLQQAGHAAEARRGARRDAGRRQRIPQRGHYARIAGAHQAQSRGRHSSWPQLVQCQGTSVPEPSSAGRALPRNMCRLRMLQRGHFSTSAGGGRDPGAWSAAAGPAPVSRMSASSPPTTASSRAIAAAGASCASDCRSASSSPRRDFSFANRSFMTVCIQTRA
jgi:hypothetical protein